jgi:hypothetical protein
MAETLWLEILTNFVLFGALGLLILKPNTTFLEYKIYQCITILAFLKNRICLATNLPSLSTTVQSSPPSPCLQKNPLTFQPPPSQKCPHSLALPSSRPSSMSTSYTTHGRISSFIAAPQQPSPSLGRLSNGAAAPHQRL